MAPFDYVSGAGDVLRLSDCVRKRFSSIPLSDAIDALSLASARVISISDLMITNKYTHNIVTVSRLAFILNCAGAAYALVKGVPRKDPTKRDEQMFEILMCVVDKFFKMPQPKTELADMDDNAIAEYDQDPLPSWLVVTARFHAVALMAEKNVEATLLEMAAKTQALAAVYSSIVITPERLATAWQPTTMYI